MQASFNLEIDPRQKLSNQKEEKFLATPLEMQTSGNNKAHETMLDEYLTEFERQIQQSSDPSMMNQTNLQEIK